MLFRMINLRSVLGVILVIQATAVLATLFLMIRYHRVVTPKVHTWTMHCDVTAPRQLPQLGNRSAVDATWQKVEHPESNLHVYAAFWEAPAKVVVVAVGNRRRPEQVFCRFWFNETCSATVRATLEFLTGHHDKEFGACFVSCPLDARHAVPGSVSVVFGVGDEPTNHMPVLRGRPTNHLPVTRNKPPRKPIELAVCLKPFYNYYNKTAELLEFLEWYGMQGVEHFTVYLTAAAVDPSVRCILKHYESHAKMKLLSWNLLGLHPSDDIHSHNQAAAINDCLYRYRQRARHVAVVDTDEFIVPRQKVTLVELLRKLDLEAAQGWGGEAGSYLFRSAFFYTKFADHKSAALAPARLLTAGKTRRTATIFPHGARSKYICKPESVREGMTHFVEEHVQPYREVQVSCDVAVVHHYRECEGEHANCLDAQTVEDRTAQQYLSELGHRVHFMWHALEAACKLGPAWAATL